MLRASRRKYSQTSVRCRQEVSSHVHLNLSLAVTACIPSFYIPKFYNLPAECIYVFCIYLRTNRIKSLVFITEMASVYCAVRTGSLNITDYVCCEGNYDSSTRAYFTHTKYRICSRNLSTFFLFWPLKNRGA